MCMATISHLHGPDIVIGLMSDYEAKSLFRRDALRQQIFWMIELHSGRIQLRHICHISGHLIR